MWWWKKRIAVVVTCSDWRLHQDKVNLSKRLRRLLRVHELDIIAFPGPDGILDQERATEWPSLPRWVKMFMDVHKPIVLAVVGHQDCRGHPLPEEKERELDVYKVANTLKTATGFKGPVVPIVAHRINDSKWNLVRGDAL